MGVFLGDLKRRGRALGGCAFFVLFFVTVLFSYLSLPSLLLCSYYETLFDPVVLPFSAISPDIPAVLVPSLWPLHILAILHRAGFYVSFVSPSPPLAHGGNMHALTRFFFFSLSFFFSFLNIVHDERHI